MNAVASAFGKFDEKQNLAPGERLKAEVRHRDVRLALTAAGAISDSFLQGSFARKTMLRPLKDVDIVCLIKPDLTGELSGVGGPQRAMDMLQVAVARRWPDAGFDEGDKPSGKALRVSFRDCDFSVDLVPAFDTDNDTILIGDRYDPAEPWKPSQTRTLNKLISARNQDTDGRFVHQVRVLKTLKQTRDELKDVPGLLFEAIMYEAVTLKRPFSDAIAAGLKRGADVVRGPVYDPAKENDLTEKWSAGQRMAIALRFDDLARRAAEARTLEQADDGTAVDAWRGVFGDAFPAAPTRKPADVLSAWVFGSRSAQGRPTTSREGTHQSGPGRGWRR